MYVPEEEIKMRVEEIKKIKEEIKQL